MLLRGLSKNKGVFKPTIVAFDMHSKSKNKPYQTGYFPVGDGHELYYELLGNPNGIPVVHLHGGPGAGFQEKDRDYFNQKKFRVLLYEQRGSNRSKPLASLKNNKTQALVDDLEKLMSFVGFKKAILEGGSWGSTLALIFAVQHPKRVLGLLVRGVFLANRFARKHFYFGGIQSFFPQEHERFFSNIPIKHRKQPEEYYFKQMQSHNPRTRKKFVREWVHFEDSCLTLQPRKLTPERLNRPWATSCAMLSSYYSSNDFFLPENYILKNTHKIQNIPTAIIQGRFDMPCPPVEAYELHKSLPKSKLVFTTAGHGGHEPETKKTIIQALNQLAKKMVKKAKK